MLRKTLLLLLAAFCSQSAFAGSLRSAVEPEAETPNERDFVERDFVSTAEEEVQEERKLQHVRIDGLVMSFQEAKARLFTRLREDYGEEIFEAIFMDTSAMDGNKTCTIGRNAFFTGSPNAGKAWERTVRKMQIRIIESLIEGKVKDYVWATAGNQDAAGHGNFFEEQYTMVMKRQAADMFSAVNLNLVARPFGMGGATSAPEIAGCAEEIYGTDVDMITWDFAMTDGRWHWRMEFFAHRVHMLDNHPVLLVLQPGTEPARRKTAKFLTDQGMAVLRQDDHYVMDQKLKFPDSRYKSEQELADMPEHVRFLRCGYGIETGAPCHENKYRHTGECDERASQTNWHRGWKWHAFHGNLYALFLMEILEDALLGLELAKGEDMRVLLDSLEALTHNDFRTFEEGASIMFKDEWNIEEGGITARQLFRDKTYCHTANLPAQARYLGYVTDNPREDTDWFDYKKGKALSTMLKNPYPEMSLTYIPRGRANKCNATLNIDFKDFFIASGAYEGFQSITVPNDSELHAYGEHASNGIIAVCAAACSFECHGSPLLSPDVIRRDLASIRVNGEDVADVHGFDNCFLLKRANGELHWPSNPSNKYDIEVAVVARKKYFRFGSFIVW